MATTSSDDDSLDTSRIKEWRSIITLIVFVLANLVVLFPFHIPVPVPRWLRNAWLSLLVKARITPPRRSSVEECKPLRFPMNFVTAPLIAVLFLLATQAIGRTEVRGGTVGADHIAPIDIMVFFLSLAYIAISIDATGLIRWLSLKTLQRAGDSGRRLFLYLYLFFFVLGTAVGNDPIVLSGTPFLAYMTRASSNIHTPRAWIFTQFAIANVASAILVSSNPTNLVLAGAFQIRYIDYTANMIVPVVITVLFLFPFLLWVVFRGKEYVPSNIQLHQIPAGRRNRDSANPSLPKPSHSNKPAHEREEEQFLDSLQEVLNPYLDKKSAIFNSVIMAMVLVSILVVNATAPAGKEYPVYWITLPAAFIVFVWDLGVGWTSRHETREYVRDRQASAAASGQAVNAQGEENEKDETGATNNGNNPAASSEGNSSQQGSSRSGRTDEKRSDHGSTPASSPHTEPPATLQSVSRKIFCWLQQTFPTILRTVCDLPIPLVPFALCMFVLVQALVTKGWIPVFAYGWSYWVDKTGVVGAIGGMAFLSVILCNVCPSDSFPSHYIAANVRQ